MRQFSTHTEGKPDLNHIWPKVYGHLNIFMRLMKKRQKVGPVGCMSRQPQCNFPRPLKVFVTQSS